MSRWTHPHPVGTELRILAVSCQACFFYCNLVALVLTSSVAPDVVWDMAAGSCTHTLEGHTGIVTRVTLSPDGKVLVSGSYDKTIRWVYTHQCTPYVHPIPNLWHWTPPPSAFTSLDDGAGTTWQPPLTALHASPSRVALELSEAHAS
ncbi:Vegetative incompatibility protein vegetative incompatibility protein HET-E-1 [Haematococcus lacustris]|uniref:Vegetative incompatibility protein vegetative incompatibility protein HET-E-1 n=1 Tax=Haematococcus lacustris TaxID=44745 RepID=A0A699ZFR9_HAELA|nr:Vegetative incompatibility protein vegetative incompatibility protein HET-E-1 [Haematococcus lacustris]